MDKNQIREVIARRCAKELKDGFVVNLGIGLPTLIPNYLPEGVKVVLQSENGLLGLGPTPEEGKENKYLVNAGGGYIYRYYRAALYSTLLPRSVSYAAGTSTLLYSVQCR